MKRFEYNRLHQPTGERTVGEIEAASLEGALLRINNWNRTSALQRDYPWVYWMDTPQLAGRAI